MMVQCVLGSRRDEPHFCLEGRFNTSKHDIMNSSYSSLTPFLGLFEVDRFQMGQNPGFSIYPVP
jgi:hypothetical protein